MVLSVQHYRDRIEAGQVLARHLAHYASRVDSLVLALSRGGVPIAAQVAAYLNAPLDTFVVHKLAAPGDDTAIVGAIAPGGMRVLDHEAIKRTGVTAVELAAITEDAAAELARDERLYRGKRPPPHISDRVVILVDDGLATGFGMHATVIALHRQQPAWLVVAAPVGSAEDCSELAQEVHEVVCPLRPQPFESTGIWYDHFAPVEDEDVRLHLRHAGGLPRV